jgi:putative membrane protein
MGWRLDPLVAIALLALALAGLRERRLVRRPLSAVRRTGWIVGVGAVAAATMSPLHSAAEQSAAAHMTQHLTLTVVAAPALAFAGVTRGLLRVLPRALRVGVQRVQRHVRRQVGTSVVPATVAHVATMWFWHAPGPYVAAMTSPLLHALEHATMIGSALWFWRVAGVRRHMAPGAAVVALFAAGTTMALLGALLTFATSPLYSPYLVRNSWAASPLADQQLAGALMWVPGGGVYLAVAMNAVARWFKVDAGHLRQIRHM